MNSTLFGSTDGPHFIEFQELQPLHCSKDALTDFFGWLLQGLLAAIAFSCLIGELQALLIGLRLTIVLSCSFAPP